MTKDEILEKMPDAETGHAAWPSFIDKMAEFEYGWQPLVQAWHFYKSGWDAHIAASQDLQHRLMYALDGIDSARGYIASYIDDVNKP